MSSEWIRLYPITRDYSGPAKRVRVVTCQLTSDYPANEYYHYSCGAKNVKFGQNSDKGDKRAEGDEDERGKGNTGGERFVEDS